MGGGIAYQSAVKGTPVIMKDINQGALDLGLSEAAKILGKGMQRGKVDATKMAQTLNAITPTLEYSTLKDADLVLEGGTAKIGNQNFHAYRSPHCSEAISKPGRVQKESVILRL